MTQFKTFGINDLFNVELSNGDNKITTAQTGNVPLISSGTENRGIVGYIKTDTKLFPKHSITLDMFGNAFYQPNAFYTVSHGRVNILCLKNKLQANERFIGLYLETAIKANTLKYNYSFSNMLSSSRVANLQIQLPVQSIDDDEPDWQYMEQYIQNIEKSMAMSVIDWLSTTQP